MHHVPYWALQYGCWVEVLESKALHEKVKSTAMEIAEQ